jgi:hypothetical protein
MIEKERLIKKIAFWAALMILHMISPYEESDTFGGANGDDQDTER